MLIDWFTVGAQALNFVILVGLMKRFLYQPILDAIDAREQRIQTELSDAAQKQAEALHQRDELKQKNDDFEQQRVAMLQRAKADAGAERGKLLDAARQAADALAAKRRESLAGESKALVQTLRARAGTEVVAIARRALTDLAGTSLEARVCEVFIARLHSLEGQPRDALAAALVGGKDAVIVRSAFELSSAQRLAIHQSIADTQGVELDLRYETDIALVAGIELVAQGQKFAWTIDDYLGSLERGVSDLLKLPVAASAAASGPSASADAAPRPVVLAAPAYTPVAVASAP